MKKTIKIEVDPAHIEMLGGEAVKAGVLRRAKGAKASAHHRVVAGLLFILTLMGGGVFAWASATQVDAPDAPPTTVQVQETAPEVWAISEEERAQVMAVVMGTARGEGELAMQAVAQALRNASEDFAMPVPEVIARLRWPSYDGEPSPMAISAVDKVVRGEMAIGAKIYYACPDHEADEAWHQKYTTEVCQIGGLRFYV